MLVQVVKQIDITALLAALDTHRVTQGLSWREVARSTGISASTFSRMASGHYPDLDGYAICCRWLGVSLDTFTAPQSGVSPDASTELVVLLRQLGVPECYWRTLVEHVCALRVNGNERPSQDAAV